MPHILIVDDHAENTYFLEVLLKGNGFTVDSAENGAQALALAQTNQPDLIISDILMPVMDGYALCSKIMADPDLSQVPFIFYTATFTTAKDESLALSLGADRFVIKPQEPDILMAIIAQALESPHATAPVSGEKIVTEYSEALFRKLEKKMADLEQAHQALKQSEEQFRKFVLECPWPIAVSNENGEVELLNRAYNRTIGYTRDDLPTVDQWWQLAYPDSAYRAEVQTAWQQALDAAVRDGSYLVPTGEYRVTCKDGTIHILEISAALIEKKLLVLFNDLTERKRVDQELQRAHESAECANHAKLRFLHTMSHELRTPLNVILGALQLSELDQSFDHELCGQAKSALFSMLEMIDNILEASQIESAGQQVKREPVHLELLLATLGRLFNVAAQNKGLQLRMSLASDLPRQIISDASHLQQILVHLLNNAIKFTEAGTVDLNIRSEASQTQGRAWMVAEIRDTGIGIAPDKQQQVFDLFTQADASSTRVYGGVGLGLYLTKRLVELMGGTINLQSAPGQGTTVTVQLPFVRDAERPVATCQL